MNNDQTNFCVVLTTTANEDQAENLAQKILTSKLGACVQVQPIKSYYLWKGEFCSDSECLLLIKTRAVLYDELETLIKANHTYEVPEIVKVPIQKGFTDYLNWISDVTSPKNT